VKRIHVLMACLLVSVLLGDSVASILDGPDRLRARSGNTVFEVDIIPIYYQEGSMVLMSERSAKGKMELRWSRMAINDVAPLAVLVDEEEGYVITFGDWGHRPVIAIAVYGPYGELRAVISYDRLSSVVMAERVLADAEGERKPEEIDGWGVEVSVPPERLLVEITGNGELVMVDPTHATFGVLDLSLGQVMGSRDYCGSEGEKLGGVARKLYESREDPK